MRSTALLITLLGLTACGTTKQVSFGQHPTTPTVNSPPVPATTAAPAEVKAEDAKTTEAKTNETKTTDAKPAAPTTVVVETDEAAAKLEAQDAKLHAVIADYRKEVENVLSMIWKKPLPEMSDTGEIGVYISALMHLMRINERLQTQPRLTDEERKMLIDGAQVMDSVRGTLVTRRNELMKAAN